MFSEQISIRSIERNEFEKLIEFDNEYLQKAMFKAGVPQDQLARSLTLDEIEEAYKRNDYLKWIFIDKTLAGYFWFEIKSDFLYLSGVAIRSEFRGKGIIQHILNLAETIANDSKSPVIKLYVSPLNTPAIIAYLKFGYQIVGTVNARFGSNNTRVFRLIMEKDLLGRNNETLKYDDKCEVLCSESTELKNVLENGYIGIKLIQSNNINKILFIKIK